jgi:hypothetical protein
MMWKGGRALELAFYPKLAVSWRLWRLIGDRKLLRVSEQKKRSCYYATVLENLNASGFVYCVVCFFRKPGREFSGGSLANGTE